MPKACRFPEQPPIVRAAVNSFRAVIPTKDSLKTYVRANRALLHMDRVVFTEELTMLGLHARTKLIRERACANIAEGKAAAYVLPQDGDEKKLMDTKEEQSVSL